ncbi:MAG: glycosyltransferase, partial [Pyrinomonadaceae bacterium]
MRQYRALRSIWRALGLSKTATELDRQRSAAERFPFCPVICLLVAVKGDPVDQDALRSTVESVRRQTYAFWQLCLVSVDAPSNAAAEMINQYVEDGGRIIHAAHNADADAGEAEGEAAALRFDIAAGEFVAVLEPGDQLAPDALYALVALLNQHPAADLIYTDEDQRAGDGAHARPVFKPAWSPEYFLSGMYTGRLSVYRRSLVAELGAFRPKFEGAHEYDLALRVVERSERIYHVRQVLYHRRGAQPSAPRRSEGVRADDGGNGTSGEAERRALRDYLSRNQVAATCEQAAVGGASHRVRYRVAARPLVSIIIPTAGFSRVVDGRGELDLLANCVQSVVRSTAYTHFEVLCIDNSDLREETTRAVQGLGDARIRLINYSGPFNIAQKMNFGVRQAAGEHFLFLNDDTEVVSAEWLEAMLEFSQQPAVGAVGAKLYFHNGSIQHAGVVI